MKLDMEAVMAQLKEVMSEEEALEMLAYIQAGLQFVPMIPTLLEPVLDVIAQFKPILERPHSFATAEDIRRFKSYITDGEMSREEALTLTIARMTKSTVSVNTASTVIGHAIKELGNNLDEIVDLIDDIKNKIPTSVKDAPLGTDENPEVTAFGEGLNKAMEGNA